MKYSRLKKGDKFRMSPEKESKLTYVKKSSKEAKNDQAGFLIQLSGDSKIIRIN